MKYNESDLNLAFSLLIKHNLHVCPRRVNGKQRYIAWNTKNLCLIDRPCKDPVEALLNAGEYLKAKEDADSQIAFGPLPPPLAGLAAYQLDPPGPASSGGDDSPDRHPNGESE